MWQEPGKLCTDLPNDTADIITSQQMITWNNDTGMNPYHSDFDGLNIAVEKLAYGEMLEQTQAMNVPFITDRFGARKSAQEFDKLVTEDYNSIYASTAKLLAAWWHMEKFLLRVEALDYDYICLRQTDTYIDYWVTAEAIVREIEEKNVTVLGQKNERQHIPVVYNLQYANPRTMWPSSNFIPSYAYFLNRPAVKILRGNLYKLALQEMDHYASLLYPHDLLLTKPGIAMLRIAVKNNIESVSLGMLVLNPEQVNRGPADADGNEKPPIDFSQLDRSGMEYTGRKN